MNESQKQQWESLLKTLRKKCPIKFRVVVLRRKEIYFQGELVDGVTLDNPTGYTIKVNTSQSWQSQLDTLIHEWAHALHYSITNWHNEEWGKCFSKSYLAYEKWAES